MYNLNDINACKTELAGFNHETAEAVCLTANIHDLLNGMVINVDETPVKTGERRTGMAAWKLRKDNIPGIYTELIKIYKNSS